MPYQTPLLSNSAWPKLIADQKAQLAGLTAKQTALTSQIAANSAEPRRRALVDQRRAGADNSFQGEMAGVETRFNSLAAEHVILETELAEVTSQQNAAQLELDARQQILAGRLIAAYETDQTPLLQQLLTAHSLTDALSDVSYYGESGRGRQVARRRELHGDERTLDELRQTVVMASTANAQLKDQVAGQQKSLDDEQTQLTAAQDQLEFS